MRGVGLKVLKNELSEYVRLATGGETVPVSDRGRVVAELVPSQPGRNSVSEDDFLARGVREGWIKPAAKRREGPPPQGPRRISMKPADGDAGVRFLARLRQGA